MPILNLIHLFSYSNKKTFIDNCFYLILRNTCTVIIAGYFYKDLNLSKLNILYFKRLNQPKIISYRFFFIGQIAKPPFVFILLPITLGSSKILSFFTQIV